MFSIKSALFAILALSLVITSNANDGNEMFELNGGLYHGKRGRLSIGSAASLPVLVDAGWYSFTYGAAGTTAYRTFSIRNSQLVVLLVNNCFCPGNTFSVFDNGQPILSTNFIGGTDCNVTIQETLPQDCNADPALFGQGSAILLPGYHNLTIVVTNSPYQGGTAFLRADTACTAPGVLPFPCIDSSQWSNTILA